MKRQTFTKRFLETASLVPWWHYKGFIQEWAGLWPRRVQLQVVHGLVVSLANRAGLYRCDYCGTLKSPRICPHCGFKGA
jgi:hypothetical protein